MFVIKQLSKRRGKALKTVVSCARYFHLQRLNSGKISGPKWTPLLSSSAYSQWSSPNIVKSKTPDIPIPSVPFHEYFWSNTHKWADCTASICGVSERKLTYNQLWKNSQHFGAALRKSIGMKTNDRLGILLPNCPEYITVIMGALEAGIIPTTMNPMYTPDEIAYQINDSEPSAVVTLPSLLPGLLKGLELNSNKNIKVIVIQPNDNNSSPRDVINYQELVSDQDLSVLRDIKRTPEDVAILPYSSGTTGRPKGVMLTNRNLTSCLLALRALDDFTMRTDKFREVIPLILPIFHIYGFAMSCLTYFHGGEVITLPKFEEESFLRSLKEATILFVAPPLVLYLAGSPKVSSDTLKTVKTIYSGAAPISLSDVDRLTKKLGKNTVFKQGYGLTETSPLVTSAHNANATPDSVGPPAVNTQIKIIDYETGQPLGPGESGELVIKGPQVMKGYWRNEKATNEVLKDGWFYTGDIGHYNPEGFFYITDRRKELIKVKGFQVAPAELEGVLRSHEDVADAGVVGTSDPLKGEKPVGFVVLKANVKQNTESLKAFLREKVAKYKQIEDFIYLKEIPKSPSGKILRKELKKMLTDGLEKAL